MKMRLVVVLVGLAIGFVLPTFAQEKETVDPQTVQQIRELATKYEEAFNKQDWAAVAALFTQDGSDVTPHDGVFHGRQAIEKHLARNFQQWHSNNIFKTVDRVIAVGYEVHSFGRWDCAFKDDAFTNRHIEGHYLWVLVREGDTWKIRKDDSHEVSRSWAY
jgi:uncharacterized protein (TIGR02246 family)